MTIWRTGPGVLLWAADGFAGARRESCSSASCSALSESRSFETATCGFCGSTFFAVSVVAGSVFGLSADGRVLNTCLTSASTLALVREMVPKSAATAIFFEIPTCRRMLFFLSSLGQK